MALTCKHCHLGIEKRGSGYVHTEGTQVGSSVCHISLLYEWHAEPEGTDCQPPCSGATSRQRKARR